MTPIVLALPENEALAASLSIEIGGERGAAEIRRFPDGETYVRLDSPVAGQEIVLVCTLDRPDEKLLPLLFLARLAKELGAARVGLVAPYLSYMRQDRRFKAGEAVTSAYFAEIISRSVDWLVTVDPHLHRRSSLKEIYAIPARALGAAPLVSAWIRDRVKNPLLVGPDEESGQWVAAVAIAAGAPYIVLQKERHGDRDVKVSVPEVDRWRGHTPVLVDDIISTGRTMIETAHHLRAAGMPAPVSVGIHGVFAANALAEMRTAGIAEIVTCNTIPHETNRIDVAPLLAPTIREIVA